MRFHSFAAMVATIAVATFGPAALASASNLDETILDLTHRWAKATYQTPPARQDEAYLGLIGAAEQASASYPGRAEPLVWQAIALSSAAKVEGGLTALSKVKQARELLLSAEKIDPTALSGSIYSSLGSLYAKVPGWPIGFGNKSKAVEYFQRALTLNPDGIDANYFYGELLADEGQDAQAMDHLKRALTAPPRPGRDDSDAGRRQEAQTLIDRLRKKHPEQPAE